MKKFFMFLAVSGIMAVSANLAVAQDQAADSTSAAATEVAAPANDLAALTGNAPEIPLHQQLKTKFIEGGPMWMAPIALVLVLGLALSIERILYLTFAKTNTKKLVANVEAALANGGVEAAKDVCRNTRGPVASIFYQGLLRYDEGIVVVE
ncbi:MAG: MotA/TolQ/ExbB proton channel family protein, partial [Bacteroidales bacterium]|nr:MotA/TolQ/ExbB proton channel family protein [Bacteroidales bacterium]